MIDWWDNIIICLNDKSRVLSSCFPHSCVQWKYVIVVIIKSDFLLIGHLYTYKGLRKDNFFLFKCCYVGTNVNFEIATIYSFFPNLLYCVQKPYFNCFTIKNFHPVNQFQFLDDQRPSYTSSVYFWYLISKVIFFYILKL